ncbi:putative Mg2+ transporter-C (MgtC) family protein [Granulicella aggregans]|uniref:Putative Mg2+ transporter-C (MgtC) family protein n=1 Tax=Granulicella aggregans TaxID=474949 RepID=A0A7W8E386_9BACT|nr:MgtC/SapB family protein [Granulicella aggregans]MBB5055895.1 putative Mg2+ transporter-C (MgtC) family protein [Granulicella aggregans]
MYAPSSYHFSDIDQLLLSSGTAKRLLLACALGGVVGIEREWRHKASGLRTNILICMACAFFTLLSAVLAGEGNPDKGRVAANIVQGIGFLGAGLILHTRNRVLGLTSAASVFAVASIGMACGAGLYLEAVLATVIVLFALQLVGALESKLGWKHFPMLYEVRGTDQTKIYVAILSVLDRMGVRMNVIDKDSVAELERVTFIVNTDRKRHAQLLANLKIADAADSVIAFQDEEEE